MEYSNQHRFPTPKQLRTEHPELFALSNFRGFLAIVSDWFQIFAAIGFSVALGNYSAYLCAIFIIGFKQSCLSESLLHYASHNTLFRTKKLNQSMEFFFSVPFIQSAKTYKTHHRKHHRFVTTENDPTFQYFDYIGLGASNISVIWNVLISPFLGTAAFRYLLLLKYMILNESVSKRLQVIAFYAGVSSILGYYNCLIYIIPYWFAPLFLIHRPLVIINEIVEHYRVNGIARQRTGWINLFMHNDGYHYIHHIYPSIPWFKLSKAQEVLKPLLSDVETCHGFVFHPLLNMIRHKEAPLYPNIPLENILR